MSDGTDVFRFADYLVAVSKGEILEYWVDHDLPTTSCTVTTGMSISAVLVIHKKILSPLKNHDDLWRLSLTCLRKDKVIMDTVPTLMGDTKFITFHHPKKDINFNVPLDVNPITWTDFRLLAHYLRG